MTADQAPPGEFDVELEAAIRGLYKWKERAEDAEAKLAAAEKVLVAARKIKATYPGGKMLWFSEFSEFEGALATYDKALAGTEGGDGSQGD